MKLHVHREIAIGLSVLLVLLAILGVVAARRFMRPSAPRELIATAEEAKHGEERHDHRLKHETDSPPQPDLLTPVAAPDRDSLRALDDPGHWNTAAKERRKETPESAPALGPVASDPPPPFGRPDKSEPHGREGERTSTYAPPELSLGASDDRYASVPNEPSSEHSAKARSRSMVVQVGNGESTDGTPRSLDRHASESHDRTVQPGPGSAVTETVPRSTFDSPAAGNPGDREEARHREEKARERGFQVTGPQADGPAAGIPADREDARHREEKARERGFQATGPQVDGAAAGIPADREDARHREREFQVTGPQVNGPAAANPADREEARHREEKARHREYQVTGPQVDGAAPRSTYADERFRDRPASPYSGETTSRPPADYGPNYRAGEARGNDAPNFSAPPGGYAPDNSPRFGDEVRGPMPGQGPHRSDGMYEVQPNDSYWTISERVYGSGAYFRALAEQNRGKAARPDRLPPGLVISAPPVGQLEKDYPDLCPRPNRRDTVRNRADPQRGYSGSLTATVGGGRTYVVQEGDTLSSIARNELGKVSRWADIYQLNREALGKDYDYLTPGLRLVLPIRDGTSGGDRTTRRSDDGGPVLH